VTYRSVRDSRGFSLLELLVSMAAMLAVSAAAFSLLNACQRSYAATVLKVDMNSGVRSAVELLTQEIGQAGLLNPPPVALNQAVVQSPNPQAVNVTSTAGMFVGEKLLIDPGTVPEVVAVTALSATAITAKFSQAHANAAPVVASGVFPQGILSTSTATQLQLLGDINADGTLMYVRYDCNAAAGTLSRSITPITAAVSNAPVVLVENLLPNPGGTPCFTYTSSTVGGFTFVTTVGITMTVQTAYRDPQTGSFDTLTKSFMNLSPRNIRSGLEMANLTLTDRLQPTPPGIPLP
jgi:prepilin-type N-terminal cleavage/methylation domain-containing protein